MEFGVSYWVTVFSALWGFMDSLFNSFGAYAYVLGGFFVFVVVRFLIGPIFGISIDVGSDMVSKIPNISPSRGDYFNGTDRLGIDRKGEIIESG